MCGIFGIYSNKYSNNNIISVINNLKLLQHRGKDGCGISYITILNQIKVHKSMGKVRDAFYNYNNMDKTNICIGHVRYSTSGKSITNNTTHYDKQNELQPLIGKNNNGDVISIVHNGNIPNLKQHDTQYLLDTILSKKCNIEETLIYIMNNIPASYSLLLIINNKLYVMRDRYGIRPLSYGFKGNDIHISSETLALENCNNITTVNSGNILRIDKEGINIIYEHPKSVDGICAFELIYFMNPFSYYNGVKIKNIRNKLGEILAEKELYDFSDNEYIVIGIPSSGIMAAKGYAKYLNITYNQLIKKKNECLNGEDRTFILLNNEDRQKACKNKFKFDVDRIKNKKIILIDDTIVRGNVIRSIIDSLNLIGIKEIHIRIPAPPIIDICQLGISIQNKNELIMNNRTVKEVGEILDVNSIQYLSLKDLTFFPKKYYKECFGGGIASEIVNYKSC